MSAKCEYVCTSTHPIDPFPPVEAVPFPLTPETPSRIQTAPACLTHQNEDM